MSGRPQASAAERRLAEAGVLASVAIWSANFVVVKAAIGVLGPLTFTSLRYLVASATLLAVLRWREGSFCWPGRSAPVLFALGAIGFGGYQVLWTLGLTQITAGDSALIIAASPVIVAVVAGIVGVDALTAPKVGGALLAFTGVALVITGGTALSLGASVTGDLLTLSAAVLWAIYAVAAARVVHGVSPLQLTTWTVVAGTVVLLPFGVAEAAVRPPGPVDAAVVVAILYSGALAAGIANVFVMHAIRLTGPTTVMATQLLVPAGAVILGAVFLSEPILATQVIGGIVIVLGVALTRRTVVLPAGLRARLPTRS